MLKIVIRFLDIFEKEAEVGGGGEGGHSMIRRSRCESSFDIRLLNGRDIEYVRYRMNSIDIETRYSIYRSDIEYWIIIRMLADVRRC